MIAELLPRTSLLGLLRGRKGREQEEQSGEGGDSFICVLVTFSHPIYLCVSVLRIGDQMKFSIFYFM